jgi:hypothetical protein
MRYMMPLQAQQDTWQQLTFKEISPKWAERLEQQKQQLPFPLSITWLRVL